MTTSLVLDIMKDHECLWKKKYIHHRNERARERTLQVIGQKPAVENVKLKVETHACIL